jgi:uncharacterized sulfatase
MILRTSPTSRRALALLCALPLLAAEAARPGAAAEPSADKPGARRPNIVLVIADDQDYEQLGFMGHGLDPTPAIDTLAEAGTVFRVAYNAGRCRSTLAGLLTGREPHQSRVYADAPLGQPLGETLPRLLGAAGYRTYAEGRFWEGDPRAIGFTDGPEPEAGEVGGIRSRTFVRESQETLFAFLDAVGPDPFFVWYAPMLPHVPHDPPARLRQRIDRARIPVPDWIDPAAREAFLEQEATSLAMVAWLDEGVAKLLAHLRARNLERETLVVFLIDNGWAHGFVSKGSPYEKGVRTPVVLHWPGRIAARSRTELVSYLDVLPTLLDYAGVPVPAGAAGRSLRPLLETAPGAAWRDTLYGAAYPMRAGRWVRPEQDVYALYLRTPAWKYILWLRNVTPQLNDHLYAIKHFFVAFPARRAGDQELYDMASDPNERDNVARRPRHQAKLQEYRERVLAWWRETGGAELPSVR